MTNCKISIWSKSNHPKSKPLGKSYRLENGKLIKDDLGTNAKHLQVVTIKNLDDLESVIDFDLYKGNGFITSGVPKDSDITEAEVTLKDYPKKGYVSRSKDDIEWRDGTGAYAVIDYDPDWSNDKLKTVDELRQELPR